MSGHLAILLSLLNYLRARREAFEFHAANLGLLGSSLFPVVATALQSFFQGGQP